MKKKTIISFDVFDTLITRKTVKPCGIFYYMEQLLLHSKDEYFIKHNMGTDFAHNRILAEELVNADENKVRVATLDDIYSKFQYLTGIDGSHIEKLKNKEFELEKENIIGIKENIRLLKKYKSENRTIVLISDMYLSAEEIQKLLCEVDEVFKDIKLFVSSEYNATKKSGELFIKVKDEINGSFNEWLHIGDNVISDYEVPSILGIKCQLKKRIIPYDKFVKQLWNESTFLSMLFSDAVKNASYESINQNFMFGASLGASILLPYVEWVLFKSNEIDVHNLFFIARDGYILKLIADLIIDYYGMNIHTKYIYGSRVAWRTDDQTKVSLIKKYIYQEMNDIALEDMAFVDLQGTGYSINCLIDHVYKSQKIHCFFYDMVPMINFKNSFHIFTSRRNNSKIEFLCRAMHGMTLGYKIIDSNVVPEIDDTYNVDDAVHSYCDGVICACNYIIKNFQIDKNNLKELRRINILATEVLENGTSQEVIEFIGNCVHSGELGQKDIMYAPIIQISEVEEYLSGKFYNYNGNDIEFSLKRLNELDMKKIRDLVSEALSARSKHNSIKVILYGAGTKGFYWFMKLLSDQKYEIVSWVDMNYMNKNNLLYEIHSPSVINNYDYDYILITVLDPKISRDIKKMLILMGVESHKIVNTL